MANIKNTNRNRLLSFFGVTTKKAPYSSSGLAPTTKSDNPSGESKELSPIKFPNDLQKVWKFFEKDLRSSNRDNTAEARATRDKELDFMIHGEGLMYTATQIYTNETTQADSQDRVVGIRGAKKATETYFYKWLAKIGLSNSVLNSIAWDLTSFGNGFYIKSVDLSGGGITKITPIAQSECKDVIEFQGVRVKDALTGKGSGNFKKVKDRFQSLKDLATIFTKQAMSTDYAMWYENYKFGYTIGENVLPPWAVTHFRRYTTSSEFYPYGRPMFIGSLVRFKSYKTTEMLIDMARPASFPTKVFEIQGHPDMTETELFEKVNQVRQMYQNITEKSKNQDEISVGESIFSVKGMVEFKQYESRMNLNEIGDLDAKRTDLILSTGIPEGYLDSSKSSWGQSGQSLLQQSKIVARNIYPNQTTIIEQLAEDFKIHLMLTGDLQGADTEFEIYMNYPVIEESSDRMRLKSDSIRLANDILNNLGTSLGLDRGEALPSEVVADVFGKYSFLDMEEVGAWVAQYEQGQEIQENYTEVLESLEDETEKKAFLREAKNFENLKYSFLRNLNYDKPSQSLQEKISDRLSEEVVRGVYFTSKRANNLTEGISLGGKHYVLRNDVEKKGSVFELAKKEKELRADQKIKG